MAPSEITKYKWCMACITNSLKQDCYRGEKICTGGKKLCFILSDNSF